jgi:hypothetical protein
MVEFIESKEAFDISKFDEFRRGNDFVFPTEYIDFLVAHNDSELASNIIHGNQNDYYIRFFYGTSSEKCSDIVSTYEVYRGRLPIKCVPIADPDFGNQICISLRNDSYGEIYFWDHELMDTDDGEPCTMEIKDMIYLAASFPSLIDKIERVELPPADYPSNPRTTILRDKFIRFLKKTF